MGVHLREDECPGVVVVFVVGASGGSSGGDVGVAAAAAAIAAALAGAKPKS